ncbi:MAG: hypothetical protein ABI464_12980 [Chthoniobacteraceae bacterium]
MLLWDEMHAYNAVHVARVPAALGAERLRRTLARVLEERGLTGLRIDAKGRGFEFRGGAASPELAVHGGGTDARETLRAEMERQINARFDHTAEFTPFRFFAVPDGDAFWLGIVYFHAIADAEPIVQLACDFVAEYAGAGVLVKRERWDCHAGTGGGSPWRLDLWLRKLLALPAQFRGIRTAIRPGGTDTDDFRNGVELFTLSGGELGLLIAAGRRLDATVNDLLLALLMHSLAPLCEAAQRPGRDRISLGCIVNARRDLRGAGGDGFGLVLGGFSVMCGLAETAGVAPLARAIARQTRRQKRGALYLANELEMRLVLRLMSLFSTNRRRRFYPKNYPLWGGLTNMNLKKLPVKPAAVQPTDYLRTVSTGAMTPLVLSVTTFGKGVNLTMSYRTSVFPRTEISAVRERFVAAVSGLEAGA